MNDYFEITEKSAENVLQNAERIFKEAQLRRGGSDGEKKAANMLFNEIKPYCDEAKKETFSFSPSAAGAVYRLSCALALLGTIFLKLSESTGSPVFACFTPVFCIAAFSLFFGKFFFNKTALDKPFKKARSQNLFFTRFSRSETLFRIVLTANTDAPKKLNTPFFGIKAPMIFIVACIIGNTLTFCASCALLLCGTPRGSRFFELVTALCLFMCIFYIGAFFVFDIKKTATATSSGVVPSLCLAEIMRLLSDNSVRFPNTEVCMLLSGAEHPCHDGAREFMNRHKRALRDIPTVFISLEDLVTSSKLAVFFKEGSGGNRPAGIIAESAEACGVSIAKEKPVIGTPMYTPFESAGFDACSFGTSKAFSAKSFFETEKSVQTSSRAVLDALCILKDAVRFYGNER